MMIIPAIDLRGGRCVRLFQGDFEQETEYSNDPAALARRYANMGFDYLHVVDLDGARDGSQSNQECVTAICSSSTMSVQLGGGIRNSATVARWLKAGVAKCVIGSAAVTEPDLVKDWMREFSAERIVIALDVNIDQQGMPMLATHGWSIASDVVLWDCVDDYLEAGLMHVLCTDIARDGTLSGPNIELYREFVGRYPEIQLQASGGVRDIEDLAITAETGAAATITGRALLDGCISAKDISSFQPNA